MSLQLAAASNVYVHVGLKEKEKKSGGRGIRNYRSREVYRVSEYIGRLEFSVCKFVI